MISAKSFRDLSAWQTAMDMAEAVYHATQDWPRDEVFGLTAQTRRAAVSIMANIAEGQGRFGPREFIPFLTIAHGSLTELECHVLLAQRLPFIDKQ